MTKVVYGIYPHVSPSPQLLVNWHICTIHRRVPVCGGPCCVQTCVFVDGINQDYCIGQAVHSGGRGGVEGHLKLVCVARLRTVMIKSEGTARCREEGSRAQYFVLLLLVFYNVLTSFLRELSEQAKVASPFHSLFPFCINARPTCQGLHCHLQR